MLFHYGYLNRIVCKNTVIGVSFRVYCYQFFLVTRFIIGTENSTELRKVLNYRHIERDNECRKIFSSTFSVFLLNIYT